MEQLNLLVLSVLDNLISNSNEFTQTIFFMNDLRY
jgi:hypothetical protein